MLQMQTTSDRKLRKEIENVVYHVPMNYWGLVFSSEAFATVRFKTYQSAEETTTQAPLHLSYMPSEISMSYKRKNHAAMSMLIWTSKLPRTERKELAKSVPQDHKPSSCR